MLRHRAESGGASNTVPVRADDMRRIATLLEVPSDARSRADVAASSSTPAVEGVGPSAPAAGTFEVSEGTVEACATARLRARGYDHLVPTRSELAGEKAALAEYLRRESVGERWVVLFPDGEWSTVLHRHRQDADDGAQESGGSVHRVALVKVRS
jgi:hypothetical protein